MATYTGETIYDIIKNSKGFINGNHIFNFGPSGSQTTTQVRIKTFFGDTHINNSSTQTNLYNDIPNHEDNTMCIRIFLGNVILENGYRLSPTVRVKGLFIFVKGNLDSSGNIIAQPSKADGQNVYLWGSAFVPAVGASGGISLELNNTQDNTQLSIGIDGVSASIGTRATGGGGSGAAAINSGRVKAGNGSAGTSYSGGMGGGGIEMAYNSYVSSLNTAGNGFLSGGIAYGGDAKSRQRSEATTRGAGGGAGIGSINAPSDATGGWGSINNSTPPYIQYNGFYGAGGLLMLVCLGKFSVYEESGSLVSSDGFRGGNGWRAGGGGSGGGSVNIMYRSQGSGTGGFFGRVSARSGMAGQAQAVDSSGNPVLRVNGGAGGAGSKTMKSFTEENVAPPKRNLIKIGTEYYYRKFNGSGSWHKANYTNDQQTFETYGMLDMEVYQLTRSMFDSLPGLDPKNVVIQTYSPSP